MLDSGRVVANAANAGALIAGAACLWAPDVITRAACGCAILCWAVECWYALRVVIDASLFRAFAANPESSPGWLDEFLADRGLARKQKTADRTLTERSAAALGLWRRQTIAFVLELAFLAAGMLATVGEPLRRSAGIH